MKTTDRVKRIIGGTRAKPKTNIRLRRWRDRDER
jgi:hypothetical protein